MRHTLPPLALALILAGCAKAPHDATPPAPAASPQADDTRTRELRVIVEMQLRGEITDAQALRLIARLNGITPTAPATAVAHAPAGPVTESAPAAPHQSAAPAATVAGGYKPATAITGRLRSIGSDSMDRVIERWTRGFARFHQGVRAQHEGKGSSTAVTALLEGRSDFGPMSRPLKAEEIKAFETKFGYAPTSVATAIDALAVYVHPTNPLAAKGLSLTQIDAAFSAARKRGGKEAITWGDLGATGDWASAPIRCYSRNSASGTYGFFRDEVLLKGEFREDTRYLAGSADVVSAVAEDKYGIGYSGLGYKTDKVAALAVAKDAAALAVAPTEASAVSGDYPISRRLLVVINREPGKPTAELHREFFGYVLSPEGQSDVRAEGYFPLPAQDITAELSKLQ